MADDTRQTVSMATLARVSVRQHSYTDARYSELSARIDAVQITARQEVEEREAHKARLRSTERIGFVILGAMLALALDRFHSLPTLAIVALSAAPEVMRELVEMFARL